MRDLCFATFGRPKYTGKRKKDLLVGRIIEGIFKTDSPVSLRWTGKHSRARTGVHLIDCVADCDRCGAVG